MKKLQTKSIVIIVIITIMIGILVGFFIDKHLNKNQTKNITTISNIEDEVKGIPEEVNVDEEQIKEEIIKESKILSDADVRNVKRGMSKEEVMKYEGIKESDIGNGGVEGDEEFISIAGNFREKTALIDYYFYKNQLYAIGILLDNPRTYMYQSLIDDLNKKYGDGKELSLYDDVVILKSSVNKKDLPDMMDSYLTLGYIMLGHDWENENTLISISYANSELWDMGYGNDILLTFESKTLSAEAEKNREIVSDI